MGFIWESMVLVLEIGVGVLSWSIIGVLIIALISLIFWFVGRCYQDIDFFVDNIDDLLDEDDYPEYPLPLNKGFAFGPDMTHDEIVEELENITGNKTNTGL